MKDENTIVKHFRIAESSFSKVSISVVLYEIIRLHNIGFDLNPLFHTKVISRKVTQKYSKDSDNSVFYDH